MSTELLEATTLEEDCLTSSLLLDLASEEEDGFTEELDSFAFSTEELEFSSFLEDEEATLPSLEEYSSAGSGETEEDSSPHATSMVRSTDRARTLLKIFTEDLHL
jgi:hypothetical protein